MYQCVLACITCIEMHLYVLNVMVYIGTYLYVFACIVQMVCIICIDRYLYVLECTYVY